ncbi:MAG: transporter, partial [Methylobacter sp.]
MKMKFWNRKFLLFWVYNGFIYICCISSSYAEIGKQNDSVAQYKKLIAEQQKEFQIQRQIIAEQGKALEQLRLRLDALTNQTAENKQASVKQASNQSQIIAAKNNNEPSTSPNRLPSKPVGQAPPGAAEKPRPPEIP